MYLLTVGKKTDYSNLKKMVVFPLLRTKIALNFQTNCLMKVVVR